MKMTQEIAETLLEIHRASRRYRLLPAGILFDQAMALLQNKFLFKNEDGILVITENAKWTACQEFNINFNTH